MSQKVHSHYLAFKAISGRKLLSYVDDIQINDRLICQKCKDILIEPYQTPCGCRLCLSCLGDLTESCNRVCPVCNDIWTGNDRCIFDRAVEREIINLNVNCINEGCTYKCKLRQLMDHLEECVYRAKKCQQCGESYPLIDQKGHISKECKISKVKCSDCDLELTRQDLEQVHRNGMGSIDHLCNNWKGVCPYGCSEDVQKNLKLHLSECQRLPVNCIMKYVGCQDLVPRGSMEDHMRTRTNYHIGLMANELIELRNENCILKTQLSESYETHIIEVECLKRTIHDNLEQIDKLTERVDEFERNISTNDKKESAANLCYSIVMTEGECLWKVGNISEKIRRAKMGGDVKICSDPFYSTSPRYRLCLKMYPNGDGNGFGNHVSIFFVIMKGEHDDEVPWPFCRKISISLLTNKKGKQNRVMNMKPDRNENCYGKPKGECNVAAGAPRFLSHDELYRSDDFVENGTITILAVID